ncbi:MAG: PQQ-binding-like beta-propeller repeat protein [Myxococcota bacterium]|nr:PQQ-binding-like beta-propeller repeat protein [Myxococcota bacterium]
MTSIAHQGRVNDDTGDMSASLPGSGPSRRLGLALVVICLTAEASGASTGWRHDGTGRYPATGPPRSWNLDIDEHVLWRTALPDWANSSPIVVGQQIFVTSEPSTLLALSTRNGKVTWQDGVTVVDALPGPEAKRARAAIDKARAAETQLKTVQREHRTLLRTLRRRSKDTDRAAQQSRLTALERQQSALRAQIERADRYWSRPRHDTIGYAAATPVSDGAHVYAVYGTGVVVGYTVSGERRWLRWLGEPHRPMRGNPYGHASSPLLVGGRLIVGLGSLQALDPATGEVRWRAGIYDDFGTPAAIDVRGTPAVATPRGLVHRASDGALLADVAANTMYVGPVTDGERVYWVGSTVAADTATGGDYASWAMAVTSDALDAGGNQVAPLWRVALGQSAIYASPAADAGVLHVVDRGGVLTLLDGRTGEILGKHDLAMGMVSASPVIADGWLYLFGEDGRAVVGIAGRSFRFHGRARTEGGRATPFAAGARLYLRGTTSLISLGER